jgi:aldehyde dehydrogenase (NAD+)
LLTVLLLAVASVFTSDINRALRFAKAIESGTVTVNAAAPLVDAYLPFGGYKQSGLGREYGTEAVKRWLEEKVRSSFFLFLLPPSTS